MDKNHRTCCTEVRLYVPTDDEKEAAEGKEEEEDEEEDEEEEEVELDLFKMLVCDYHSEQGAGKEENQDCILYDYNYYAFL